MMKELFPKFDSSHSTSFCLAVDISYDAVPRFALKQTFRNNLPAVLVASKSFHWFLRLRNKMRFDARTFTWK